MVPTDLTALLVAARHGDSVSRSRLFTAVYDELKRIAAAKLRHERPDHTLQPSALVNEACLRLLGGAPVQWENRAHFFTTAAGVMRNVLVDHARARRAAKRPDARQRVDLDAEPAMFTLADIDQVLAIDRALTKLAAVDARKAAVVELRWFGGFDVDEAAKLLDVSSKTVKRDWTFARAWLRHELE